MSENPVERELLNRIELEGAPRFASVEVRRITVEPGYNIGAHWHNGPVFGVIESGSVYFQVGSRPQTVLRAGDTFHEPNDETITRFDATGEGVTFVAWFPVPEGVEPTLTLGELPG